MCSYQFGNVGTCVFDSGVGIPSEAVVPACCIAEFVTKKWKYLFKYTGINRRGGAVVQINWERKLVQYINIHAAGIYIRLMQTIEEVCVSLIIPYTPMEAYRLPI